MKDIEDLKIVINGSKKQSSDEDVNCNIYVFGSDNPSTVSEAPRLDADIQYRTVKIFGYTSSIDGVLDEVADSTIETLRVDVARETSEIVTGTIMDVMSGFATVTPGSGVMLTAVLLPGEIASANREAIEINKKVDYIQSALEVGNKLNALACAASVVEQGDGSYKLTAFSIDETKLSDRLEAYNFLTGKQVELDIEKLNTAIALGDFSGWERKSTNTLIIIIAIVGEI